MKKIINNLLLTFLIWILFGSIIFIGLSATSDSNLLVYRVYAFITAISCFFVGSFLFAKKLNKEEIIIIIKDEE